MSEQVDLDALEAFYTPHDTPDCRLCGEPMAVVQSGGGKITWACMANGNFRAPGLSENERRQREGHYTRSRWERLYTADRRVLTLIAIARAAQAVAAYDGSSANVFHDLMAQLRDALAAIKEAGK